MSKTVEEKTFMLAFLQVIVAGVITGCLYGLLALGIVLVYRTTGVLNFAYGAMAAVCTCFMDLLLTGPHMNFWLACLMTLFFALIFGMVLERIFARPVLHAPVFTKAIATLALALVLETIAQSLWPQLTAPVHFPTPFEGKAIHLAGIYLSLIDVLVLLTTAVLMLGLHFFLMRTKLGIAMRATSDGVQTARLMGIPVSLVFLIVWSLSAGVAAIAGVLFASHQGLIEVRFMDPILLLAFVGAVLGGLDSLPGALIGGILVGLFDNLLALLLAGHTLGSLNVGDPGVRSALIFGGFVLVLLLRPQGLFGRALLRRV